MKPDNNLRLGTADLLKGIAVILMIQVHLTELFARPELRDGLIGKISLFLGGIPAAPVFMAVMGYFAIQSKNTAKSIIRGLKIILLGFLLNLGMNAHLLYEIQQHIMMLDPLPYIFGADILFLAGFSLVFIASVKSLIGEKLWLWAIIALFIALAGLFLPEYSGEKESLYYVQAFFWGSLSWSYFPVIPWMIYPIAGLLFYMAEKQYSLFISRLLGSKFLLPVLAIIALSTIPFGFGITTELQTYYHHGPLFILWALVFLAFWVLLLVKIYASMQQNRISLYVEWIGKNVTVFYVVQWLLIGNIATEIYQSQPKLLMIVWFILILSMTSIFVLGWVWLKTFIRNKKRPIQPEA